MMRLCVLNVLLLAAACASGRVSTTYQVHEGFAGLRPVTLRLETPDEDLRDAVYRGLIARDYSVVVPGAAPEGGAGRFEVKLLTAEEPWAAEAVLTAPDGKVLYRAKTEGYPDALAGLGAFLLRGLPRK